jgi:hypothetical protein
MSSICGEADCSNFTIRKYEPTAQPDVSLSRAEAKSGVLSLIGPATGSVVSFCTKVGAFEPQGNGAWSSQSQALKFVSPVSWTYSSPP